MLKLPDGPIMLSRNEFKEILFEVRGARPITVTAKTIPDLVGGKKCPLHGLTKTSVVNGMIGTIYENAVNRVRERLAGEDEVEPFVAGPRVWGSRLYTTDERRLPLVDKAKHEHPYISFEDLKATPADQLYLEVQVKKSLGRKYELNGEEIPEADVLPHLRKVEQEVILRDYAIRNIQAVVMDGQTLILGEEVFAPQLFKTHKSKGAQAAV